MVIGKQWTRELKTEGSNGMLFGAQQENPSPLANKRNGKSIAILTVF